MMNFYRNGALCRFTGTRTTIAGGLFFEFVWLDGPRAGEHGFTQNTHGLAV